MTSLVSRMDNGNSIGTRLATHLLCISYPAKLARRYGQKITLFYVLEAYRLARLL